MFDLLERKFLAIKPPIIAPKTTIKFHFLSVQSDLKKSINLPAPAMEHIVARFEDIANVFPK